VKGHISLKDFIHQVRDELVAAQDKTKDPFYELESVELEVTFGLDIEGGAKGKLVVVELGGKTKASQTHKVTLTLKPLPVARGESQPSGDGSSLPQKTEPTSGTSFGGGGGDVFDIPGVRSHGPVYAPVRD
jgi:hypothetical protein